MSKRNEIETGQCFLDLRARLFTATKSIWRVQDQFVNTDGLKYVRLTSVSDPTLQKSLSLAAILDKRYFTTVEDGE
jgi:hypothetical protein